MLEFFENKEDYEKCNTLKKIMDESYISCESKQNELNSELNHFVSYINSNN
jgi:hypothetical protein